MTIGFETKVYAKNSFDRFGDDLTELILSYLTFEDKKRLECVSKQWRRLVFNKQFVLNIAFICFSKDPINKLFTKERQMNGKILECFLKKCPNIMKVIMDMKNDTEVLSLISRYCPRIKSLTYYSGKSISEEVLSFFRMYGHKLEELDYCSSKEVIHQILELCPNVKTISINADLIYKEDKEFLPKLEVIDDILYINGSYRAKGLKILSDKYSQTMKILNVTLSDMSSKRLKTCIECISRFENLRELKLDLESGIKQPIDDCLSLIGQKCNKLLRLDLTIESFIPISDRFFDVFTQFKAIKKLELYLPQFDGMKGNVECFKYCQQLNDLHIVYTELREDFFANIETFVPKLQSLQVLTKEHFSDSFIDSFHSLKNIQKVSIYTYWRDSLNFPISDKNNWYFGKCLIEVMLSPNGMNVKHISHNCGLITIHER